MKFAFATSISAAFLAVSLFLAPVAIAQDKKTQTETASPNTVQEGFAPLRAQGRTIVAEPVPNRLSVPFDEALRVTSRGDVMQFRVNHDKQFALPAVTFEEVYACMRNSRKTAERWWKPTPIPPRSGPTTYRTVTLVRHLEKAGVNRVPLTMLSPEDRDLVNTLLFASSTGDMVEICAFAERYFSRFNDCYLIRENQEKVPDILQLGINGKEDQVQFALQSLNSPPAPFDLDTTADMVPGETTLRQLVKTLSGKTETSLSLAPELADKPVIVQQADKQKPETLLRAVASFYKLRTLRNESALKLAMALPVQPTTPEQTRLSLLQSVPVPLLDWMFKPSSSFETDSRLEMNPQLRQYLSKLSGYLNQVYDKHVKSKDTKRVPVSELSAKERSAVAVLLASRYLEHASDILEYTPTWQKKYNEIIVEVGRQTVDGEEMGFVVFRDSEGKPMKDISGVRFSEVPE